MKENWSKQQKSVILANLTLKNAQNLVLNRLKSTIKNMNFWKIFNFTRVKILTSFRTNKLTDLIVNLKRSRGTCMEYTDVVWLVAVTLTNLGYGEFTPSFWISRAVISCLSLGGLIQTALIVGVLSVKGDFCCLPSVGNRFQ